MFAVFQNGGKQYKVCADQVIRLEKINATLGEEIELNEIMMVGKDGSQVQIGSPYVAGASVKIQIVGHDQDDKVIIFKKRRRKNYRRKTGHRQPNTLVKVMSITTK